MNPLKPMFCGALLAGLLAGCEPRETKPAGTSLTPSARMMMDPMAVILVPHTGADRVDGEIRQRQEQIRAGRQPDTALEQLGWLFVTKARASFDPGYYKLAEQCAFALEKQTAPDLSTRSNWVQSTRLLRGHVLHNLHRFKEAEPLARELVAQRGSPMDFALLGDVLMEQGQLDAAVDAYQKMMDRSPDSRAYARVAHLRWLKGDLSGAIAAMQVAVGAVGSRDTESAAWMQTRLAFYQFQAGNFLLANRACDAALNRQTNYAPAQLIRGRILLAGGKNADAAEQFLAALKSSPLPEYYWAASEALTAADRAEEARQMEALLHRHGVTDDPRTYALFLATREVQPALALKLAREETQQRADVFTYDSLAWAYCAAGEMSPAQQNITRALAEGTQDARIFLHAAVIAQRNGDVVGAKNFLKETYTRRHLLWPSERKHLEKTMTASGWQPAADQLSSIHP